MKKNLLKSLTAFISSVSAISAMSLTAFAEGEEAVTATAG